VTIWRETVPHDGARPSSSRGVVFRHAGIKAKGEEFMGRVWPAVGGRARGQRDRAGCDRRWGERGVALPAATVSRSRTFDGLVCFHGRKSVEQFPSGTISPWAKKSPSGVAPEGLKSLGRSEPSRRARGGDDGYNNGGQAKGGGEACCSVVVHLMRQKKADAAFGVEAVFIGSVGRSWPRRNEVRH